ncbi:Hypothetical predicted protein [Mytilus galloprovincialis]|uniref:Uncharacterized protein n=1 Tax=Mytilus galloprovincialis TaxID=29158 RepID=A0A8B6FHX1_MYTGA|nr:Hypothetical predicted protein [Mytilus galloprovincialis]
MKRLKSGFDSDITTEDEFIITLKIDNQLWHYRVRLNDAYTTFANSEIINNTTTTTDVQNEVSDDSNIGYRPTDQQHIDHIQQVDTSGYLIPSSTIRASDE